MCNAANTMQFECRQRFEVKDEGRGVRGPEGEPASPLVCQLAYLWRPQGKWQWWRCAIRQLNTFACVIVIASSSALHLQHPTLNPLSSASSPATDVVARLTSQMPNRQPLIPTIEKKPIRIETIKRTNSFKRNDAMRVLNEWRWSTMSDNGDDDYYRNRTEKSNPIVLCELSGRPCGIHVKVIIFVFLRWFVFVSYSASSIAAFDRFHRKSHSCFRRLAFEMDACELRRFRTWKTTTTISANRVMTDALRSLSTLS